MQVYMTQNNKFIWAFTEDIMNIYSISHIIRPKMQRDTHKYALKIIEIVCEWQVDHSILANHQPKT